jgi:hypothetical protein
MTTNRTTASNADNPIRVEELSHAFEIIAANTPIEESPDDTDVLPVEMRWAIDILGDALRSRDYLLIKRAISYHNPTRAKMALKRFTKKVVIQKRKDDEPEPRKRDLLELFRLESPRMAEHLPKDKSDMATVWKEIGYDHLPQARIRGW